MGNRHKSNLTGIMLGLGISFNQFFPKKKNLFKKKKSLFSKFLFWFLLIVRLKRKNLFD